MDKPSDKEMHQVLRDLVGELKPAAPVNPFLAFSERLNKLAAEVESLLPSLLCWIHKDNLGVSILMHILGNESYGFNVCLKHDTLSKAIACTLRNLAKTFAETPVEHSLYPGIEILALLPDDVILSIVRWMVIQESSMRGKKKKGGRKKDK